jgi:CheY-like chemotaxis protein
VTSDPLSQQEEKKKKILFVDDEPDMTTILKMALKRIGFGIDIFNDPVLALESFKQNFYDLVLLDVMMPKMDGFELYNQLKKIDDDITVCFLTASSKTYREQLRKEKYSELNKDLFLEMPLPISRIREEINRRIDS